MSRDLFGDEIIEEVEDEELETPKKTSPFEFIKSVSNTKVNMLEEAPEKMEDYDAYLANKGFSYFPDSVLYANELNLYPDMPGTAQYMYYFASLRKRNRFSEWYKLEVNPDQKLVQQVYNVRPEVARQYLKLLSEDDLSELRTMSETGEKPAKTKKK